MKYYRAPRYRARCVIIVVVRTNEGGLVTQVNDIHFRKQRTYTKTLTELQIHAACCSAELRMRCFDRPSTKLGIVDTKVRY